MKLSIKLKAWLKQRKILSLERQELAIKMTDAAERRVIATAFNDRYCAAERFDKTSEESVPGDSGPYGLKILKGFRWMCPDCNALHEPLSHCIFAGLVYPACCTHRRGSRNDTLGKKGTLKRPLGWAGPKGLYRKLLRAGIHKSSAFHTLR